VCSLIFIVRASAPATQPSIATMRINRQGANAIGATATARRRHGHRFTGQNDVTVAGKNRQRTSIIV
jgi:hypothetical protein